MRLFHCYAWGKSNKFIFPFAARDCAVTHNGIALICRPGVEDDKDQPGRKTKDKEKENRKREKGTGQNIAGRQDCLSVRAVLKKELGLTVVDLESPEARLSGSDVLFTGRHVYFYTTLRPFSGQSFKQIFISSGNSLLESVLVQIQKVH